MRVLSMVLCLVMCLTLMPVTALAAGEGGSGDYTLTPLPSDISSARVNPTPGVTGEMAIEICQGQSYDAVIYKVEGDLYYFVARNDDTWVDPNRGMSLDYISSLDFLNSWAVIGTVVEDGADIFTPLPNSIENTVVKPVDGLTLEQALEICQGSSYDAVIYKIENDLVYFVVRNTEWMDSGRPMGLDYIRSINLDNWAVIGTIEGHVHDWKYEAVKSNPSLEMPDTIIYYCGNDGCPSGYTKDSPFSLKLCVSDGVIVSGTSAPVSFSSEINTWEAVTGKAKPVIEYYKDASLSIPVVDIAKEISGTFYAVAKVEGTDIAATTRFTITYIAEDLLVGNANAGNTIKSKDFDESDTFLANPDYWMDVWLDDGYINTSWIYTPAGSSVEEEIEGTTFNEWGGSELTLKPEWVGGTIYVIIDFGDGFQVRSKTLLIKEATVELSWQDDSYVGQWNAYPGATEYWVVLYKDGKAITDSYRTTRPGPVFGTTYDFKTMLSDNGNGVYSFKVSPCVDDKYLSNDNWAPSIAYGVTPTECAHYYTQPIGPRKAATCTEAGLTEGSKCADCGKILRAQTEIKKLTHDYSIEIGEGQHKCSMCGDIKVDFNLSWEENSYVGKWNAYPGATQYWVKLYKNGVVITDSYRTTRPGPVNGTSYDFRSMIQGLGSGTYKFAVSPYVDGAYKSNDSFSAEVTYVAHSHDFSEYISNGDGTHKIICVDCDTVLAGHEAEACVADDDGKCAKCGAFTDGWQKVDGKWKFYMDGVAQTGWIKDGGKWYYFDADGNMKTGWVKDGGKWYYMASSGAMSTGWKQIKDVWYYFGTNGVMVTGWQKISNKWYYFEDGAMVTGWQKLSNKWYYFDDGAMVDGWKKLDGKWYYFDGGAMTTGWKKLDNKWYYFGTSGVMTTGWKQIDSKWYYFGTDGVMVSNKTITIDGKKYTFNASGVWVK